MQTTAGIFMLYFILGAAQGQMFIPGVNPVAGLPFMRDARDVMRIDDVTAEELQRQTEQEIIASSYWLPNSQPYALSLLNLSTACVKNFSLYVEALNNSGLQAPIWALKMADATGKPESGVLDGNGFYEGRAPLCRRANERLDDDDIVMTPHWCSGTYSATLFGAWLELEPLDRLNVSRTDWWKMIWRGLGVCIPDTCDVTDAKILIRNVYNFSVPEFRQLNVQCHSREPEPLDTEAIVTIVILSLFGAMAVIASLYDAYKPRPDDVSDVASDDVSDGVVIKMASMSPQPPPYSAQSSSGTVNMAYATSRFDGDDVNANNNNAGENSKTEKRDVDGIEVIPEKTRVEIRDDVTNKNESTAAAEQINFKNDPGVAEQVLACFSLYQNVPVILSAHQPRDAIGCINGIRFIAMACVLLGHSYSSAPYENYDYAYKDMYSNTINAKMLSMDLYVDTFFILSSFLMSMSFLRQLKRHNGLTAGRLALHYFNRYWRLTPTYMIIMMVYTNLTHYFARGLAPDYIPDVDSCETEWWKNMLYINNFTGLQCYSLSWYLAVDMQLFIIAPLFLYLLYRWENIGFAANVLGFTGGIIANIVLNQQLYSGTMDSSEWFDKIYIMPWTRCPVYFMGMMLGFYFVKTDGGKFKIPWYVAVIGWIVAGALYVILPYLPSLDGCMSGSGGVYMCHWTEAAKVVWSTLYRPLWGVWVCWLICACHTGWAGVINTFLSWNFFIPLGRLTYLNYLIHVVFIGAFMYNTPVQFYATDYFASYVFFALLLVSNVTSLVLCSVISAPLTRLAVVFLPSSAPRNTIR